MLDFIKGGTEQLLAQRSDAKPWPYLFCPVDSGTHQCEHFPCGQHPFCFLLFLAHSDDKDALAAQSLLG